MSLLSNQKSSKPGSVACKLVLALPAFVLIFIVVGELQMFVTISWLQK